MRLPTLHHEYLMDRLRGAERLDLSLYREEYRSASIDFANELCVDGLARLMKAKLASARRDGRQGWHNSDICSIADLRRMFDDQCLRAHPDFVDVANMAMMLHYRTRGLKGWDADEIAAAVAEQEADE